VVTQEGEEVATRDTGGSTADKRALNLSTHATREREGPRIGL
jgi:hypothetical protein